MADVAQTRSFDSPDDSVSFACGRTDFVRIGGSQVSRSTLLPGWRQRDAGGLVAARATAVARIFFHVSGRLRVSNAFGEESVSRPGAVTVVPDDGDAWVEGEDPVVLVELVPVIANSVQPSGLWLL